MLNFKYFLATLLNPSVKMIDTLIEQLVMMNSGKKRLISRATDIEVFTKHYFWSIYSNHL